MQKTTAETSAFPATLAELGEVVREAEIDVAAFHRPLSLCRLSDCRGTCCHDGAYLESEEACVIRRLAGEERERFAAMGLQLPTRPVVYGSWRGACSGPKTVTRPFPMSELARDYPAHFPDTNCVFLLPDARCALQKFAQDEGLDPWHYKPVSCWLHPISLTAGDRHQPAWLTLYTPETDPQRFPDYAGFASCTPCGRTDPCGQPAHETLAGELRHLSRISGRDLLAEIRANPVESLTQPC